MPELLGLLLLSLFANVVSVYIWFQQVHLLRNDEKMIHYLKTQIAQRNGLIARLVHEADKDLLRRPLTDRGSRSRSGG